MGGQDAAYNTALITEWCELMGVDLTGGAADIYKCFDQLSRPLIYKVLEEAGMPTRVLDAYRKYLEELTIYNTIAGGLRRSILKAHEYPARGPAFDDGCGDYYASMDHANEIHGGQSKVASR